MADTTLLHNTTFPDTPAASRGPRLIGDLLGAEKVAVSFEFFPPRSERGWPRLYETVSTLIPLRPSYVSVTYGAGGSTRKNTHELVVRIQRDAELPVVAHLTCVGSGREEIRAILERYDRSGVHNILALRGDPPENPEDPEADPWSDFRYAADLVRFIKENYPNMGIGVAGFAEGHPATPNRLRELDYLKTKVDAGADYIVTQLFFDNRDFYDFCDRCALAGITVPVIPGIMPIISQRNMERIAELAAGARFPAPLLKSIDRAHGDDYVRNVGIHWAAEQVRDLIDNGVQGVHFYTLNKPTASVEICAALGLRSFQGLSA